MSMRSRLTLGLAVLFALVVGGAFFALASRSWHFFLVTTLIVGVVEVGLGWYIWRSLSGGLSRLLQATREVSQRDFSQPVLVTSKDEFGELASSFNAMILSLRQSQDENLRLTQEALRMREERVCLLQERLVRVVQAQEEERQRVARSLVTDYLDRSRRGGVNDPYDNLTDRERETFHLIAAGYTNRKIADILHLSVNTVHNHRTSIMGKLGLHNRMELLKYAIRKGLVSEEK